MTITRSKRPPRTRFLCKFESSIAQLNDFLWASLAAYECTVVHRPKNVNSTTEFISNELAIRLSIGAEEFDRVIALQSDRLYRLLLVEAIVYYEEYLKSIVKEAVLSSWVIPKKSVKISVILPEGGNESDFLASARGEIAKELSERVVKESYSKRHNELDKLLCINSVAKGEHGTDHNYIFLAGEFRNAIVHCGGFADERTVNNCAHIVPGLSVGVALPLTRELLLDLFKALLSHARDIDLILRRKSKGSGKI